MITTLLIDVDGVLQFHRPEFTAAMERDYNWRHGYMAFQRQLLHDPAEAKALLGHGDLLDVIAKSLPEHVAGLKPEIFFDRWLRENVALNDELIALLAQVRVEAVYIATNQEPRRAERVKALYDGQPWLTGFLISSELGYAKPDPAFFTASLQRIGRKASECLLIDDNTRYLAGAAEVGIDGIRFRTNLELAQALTRRGLLNAAGSRSG